jgi:hypothetical protein
MTSPHSYRPQYVPDCGPDAARHPHWAAGAGQSPPPWIDEPAGPPRAWAGGGRDDAWRDARGAPAAGLRPAGWPDAPWADNGHAWLQPARGPPPHGYHSPREREYLHHDTDGWGPHAPRPNLLPPFSPDGGWVGSQQARPAGPADAAAGPAPAPAAGVPVAVLPFGVPVSHLSAAVPVSDLSSAPKPPSDPRLARRRAQQQQQQ